MVWRITRWTSDRQPLSSPKEFRAHRDESMGKAEIFHLSHTLIPLLKVANNYSLSVKNPLLLERGSNPDVYEKQKRP